MSLIGKKKLAEKRESDRIRREEVYLQYIAGASAPQLAEKYHVGRSQIYNLISQAEKDHDKQKS